MFISQDQQAATSSDGDHAPYLRALDEVQRCGAPSVSVKNFVELNAILDQLRSRDPKPSALRQCTHSQPR